MCFDRNINGNRDVKFLGCDYLLVQRCVKLTLLELATGPDPTLLTCLTVVAFLVQASGIHFLLGLNK